MNETCQHSNPLIREGTSQTARELWARDPDNISLHDLNVDDWIEFAYDLSGYVNYFQSENPEKPDGNWQRFFEDKEEIKAFAKKYSGGEADPMFGLFITFLKLLAFPQKSLNRLTKKHLDYYYREVLQLKEKPFTEDSVHILFELAKNAKNTLIEEGTLLDAGNDSDGNPLRYRIQAPVVVNPANVEKIRSVFTDESGMVRYAFNSKHPEGLDEDADDNETWMAFGNNAWQSMEPVFYLGSDLLRLAEGERIINLKILLDTALPAAIPPATVFVEYTSEEEWIACENVNFSMYSGNRGLQFRITLDTEAEAFTVYDDEVHENGLQTRLPLLRIKFTNPGLYTPLQNCRMESCDLSVEVTGIRTLQMQNEHGNIDAAKPFMPFGSAPKAGSKLKVKYDELAGKPVTEFGFGMKWLNLPANFTEHYKYYQPIIFAQVLLFLHSNVYSGNIYQQILIDQQQQGFLDFDFQDYPKKAEANLDLAKSSEKSLQIAEQAENQAAEIQRTVSSTPEDNMKSKFRFRISSGYTSSKDFPLFDDEEEAAVETGSPKSLSSPEIELSLLSSFYHDLYPKLYVTKTIEAADKKTPTPGDLPNAPYTPLLDELTLSYKAKTSWSAGASGVTLFHRHPFGTEKNSEEDPSLLPAYPHKYLFIGLKNLEPGNNVSLLFQTDEGSENPDHSYFTKQDEPEWAVLSPSGWTQLEGRQIARNTTNNFLRSGIVELQIPKKPSGPNSILDEDLTWIRVLLKKEADAVARFIDIHAQAALASFTDLGNTKDHLVRMLEPGTISQLVFRRSAIKSADQPYPSFGGKPAEQPQAFYCRVSERLRHKNRAVSIWDYEHLVLEEFPEIYKVKCLNHTKRCEKTLRELAPGNVSLVLIPKISGLSGTFRLQPRVSQDLMDRVEDFLKKRMPLHANLQIMSPDYDEVSFRFDIMFRPGLDFNHYQLRTEEDLKKWLTPWAFEPSADILFGESLYIYEVIHFLEKLDYVDYVEHLEMFHRPAHGSETKKEVINPENPMAILITGKHEINPVIPC